MHSNVLSTILFRTILVHLVADKRVESVNYMVAMAMVHFGMYEPIFDRLRWSKGLPVEWIWHFTYFIEMTLMRLIPCGFIAIEWPTPTPRPLIETTVSAANKVMMTPTTNAVGMIAKLKRLNRWCPKVRASWEEEIKKFKLDKCLVTERFS